MLEDKELRSDVKRILFYLENDDRTGKPGLVKEVSHLTMEQESMKNQMVSFISEYRQAQALRKRDIKWLAVIWSGITTGALLLAKALVGVFFK